MRALVVLVLVTACAAEPATITPAPVGLTMIETATQLDPAIAALTPDASPDLCALAAELPPEDPCSLACDPEALAVAMVEGGAETGRCYLLYCQMSETVHATLGVCLL